MSWLIIIFALAVIALVAFYSWRLMDHRADAAEFSRLRALQPGDPLRFTYKMVSDLPEPAQRFFKFAIAEGAPLYKVTELEMEGEFGMGNEENPNYLHMRATQVLAPPHGFIWSMSAGRGVMHMSGSDSAGWTRFWLYGLAPVARIGIDPDHDRSAFGRYIAEAVLWTPAALLPGEGITWEKVSDEIARVIVKHGDLTQAVDVTIAPDGQPLKVEFQRWSNANPDKTFRLQPFGGYLSDFKTFQGFRLPTSVEAGNFFGTDDYFPFFKVSVTSIRFPDPNRP